MASKNTKQQITYIYLDQIIYIYWYFLQMLKHCEAFMWFNTNHGNIFEITWHLIVRIDKLNVKN